MRCCLLLISCICVLDGQPLAGTADLNLSGDPAEQMVEGITRYLIDATRAQIPRRQPTAKRLREILGVVDERVSPVAMELQGTTARPALLVESSTVKVYAVRWPVLKGLTAEGLLFEPSRPPVARVVAVPDAGQLPENLGEARRMSAAGIQVVVPLLIDRKDTWSGNPSIRMTNQPHREFIYRMAFMVGRTIAGYEIQKALAAVDWFSAQSNKVPIGIWGYGEGGAIALYAGALDERLSAVGVSGYFGPRENLWKEPLDRNIFGLLKDFGGAEIARLIAPRALIVDTTAGPSFSGPSTARPNRRGAAPGQLAAVSHEDAQREFDRIEGRPANFVLKAGALDEFLKALGAASSAGSSLPEFPVTGADERLRRQFDEMVEYNQKLARHSAKVRDALWSKTEGLTPEQWDKVAPQYRAMLWDRVIGRLPESAPHRNVRTRKAYSGEDWIGYDVVYDVAPDVTGYGVLLLPKDLQPGQRRPVVVAQHGLEGRPRHLFGLAEQDKENGKYTDFHFYQNIGSRMASLGYVVYMPQNPYIGDFRKINRLANPLGWSLFSFILAQHEAMLDWLETLPFVDPARIGFYGLSYGGKTAVRVPTLLTRYALSICSGDFNEWVYKVTTADEPYSYMFTQEYEIPEWNLAHVANHAEMAKLMAPRPFMVERGHRDGVGVDEWVAFEYAKVKRFYDEMGVGGRTEFEYFNGPHMIHGKGTVAFLRKHLGR